MLFDPCLGEILRMTLLFTSPDLCLHEDGHLLVASFSRVFLGVLFTYAQGLKHEYREWISGTKQKASLRAGARLRWRLGARGLGWWQKME